MCAREKCAYARVQVGVVSTKKSPQRLPRYKPYERSVFRKLSLYSDQVVSLWAGVYVIFIREGVGDLFGDVVDVFNVHGFSLFSQRLLRNSPQDVRCVFGKFQGFEGSLNRLITSLLGRISFPHIQMSDPEKRDADMMDIESRISSTQSAPHCPSRR